MFFQTFWNNDIQQLRGEYIILDGCELPHDLNLWDELPAAVVVCFNIMNDLDSYVLPAHDMPSLENTTKTTFANLLYLVVATRVEMVQIDLSFVQHLGVLTAILIWCSGAIRVRIFRGRASLYNKEKIVIFSLCLHVNVIGDLRHVCVWVFHLARVLNLIIFLLHNSANKWDYLSLLI